MDFQSYDDVFAYLSNGIEPKTFTSTRSNFRALCRKYAIVGGCLYRDGKPVVKQGEEEQIFLEFHKHAGQVASWLKIRRAYLIFSDIL